MKNFFLFFLIFASCALFSQENLVLEKIKPQKSTRIIGMYPQYDKDKTYEKYNFYIDNQVVIDSLIKHLKFGNPTDNIGEENDFSIIVLEGNKIVNRWIVSPRFNNINIEGRCHYFDTLHLKKLSKKYPFKYAFENKIFKNQSEYTAFKSKLIQDKSFLFLYEPDFNFDGSFDLEFKKTSEFPHPEAIDNYLRPKILKFASEKEFQLAYVLNDYNMKYRRQYTMTLTCKYDLFKKFSDDKAIKSDWKPETYEAIIFRKTAY